MIISYNQGLVQSSIYTAGLLILVREMGPVISQALGEYGHPELP